MNERIILRDSNITVDQEIVYPYMQFENTWREP